MIPRKDALDVRPFLTFTAPPTRPLGAALPALDVPAGTSPWTPRLAEAATATSAAELADLADQARERGRAEGFDETAGLRAQLTDVIDQLVAARTAVIAPAAEVIAEICACVLETWLGHADRGERLAPIVRGWLAASDQPAAARVHPDDVAALAQLIGDAPLAIVGDPALAPGALAIRGAALEVSYDWGARLPDLRAAITAALTTSDPTCDPTSEPSGGNA